MSDMIKIGLKLLLITAVATFALAFTNMITLGPINDQIAKASNEARTNVLSEAKEFDKLDVADQYPNIVELHKGTNDGVTAGYTFKVKNKGYGGDLETIVGISSDGKVEGVRIGQHKETPGLGAKALEPAFQNQFNGKTVEKTLAVKTDIQAISGATITSKAVTDAVNTAIEYFNAELLTGGDK